MINSSFYMNEALLEAHKAYELNEVPVGAVIVDNLTGKIISRAHNLCESKKNPLLHAEFIVINESIEKLQQKYLSNCSIFVNLEPCILCASAIEFSRVSRIYYGASDPKKGAIDSTIKFFNSKNSFHKPDIFSGILYEDSVNIIKEFFTKLRSNKI